MGKDKVREKHKNKTKGRCISYMEILHVMLKYPDVVTNLNFIKVSTLSLDLRAGNRVDFDTETEDAAYVIAAVEAYWRFFDLEKSRLHIQNKPLILYGMKQLIRSLSFISDLQNHVNYLINLDVIIISL